MSSTILKPKKRTHAFTKLIIPILFKGKKAILTFSIEIEGEIGETPILFSTYRAHSL
ncbi:hypothetical protein NITGR_710013 [Nitrospina gracilis 3/211]|uniref:Uncharacterized protein n=1 Tax=Nitrospina gracilis (strain 3/211) TaxID=1266370 RepID=M1Z0I1_NITG3|nr:hypothetical protein NITGR_710013 [Nitrospina gracilis 3/211]